MISFKSPHTYADVKANLQTYTIILVGIVALLFSLLIVPREYRKLLEVIVPFDSKLTGSAISFVIFEFLGWILIPQMAIHDKIYDRHFVRWRCYYDLDYILPRLTQPIANHLDPRFFDVAAHNRYDFMKVYYHFVGDRFPEDRDQDSKIGQNLIHRFYVAITTYWVTQVNEIIIFLCLLFIAASYFIYKHYALPLDPIVIACFVLILAFLGNRYFVRTTLSAVRQATADEIEEIHKRFMPSLEQEIKSLHAKFNLQYRP